MLVHTRFILLFVIFNTLTACVWTNTYDASYIIPFTQTLRTQADLTTDEIKQLYFYVSRPITLRYQVSSGNRQIENGHLVRKIEKVIDEVIIEMGTRGIAVAVGDNWIDVSFEKNDAFLRFGLSKDANWQDRYPLWASNWQDGQGELNHALSYDNKAYVAIRESQHSFLKVDSRYLKMIEQKQRWAEGRQLPAQ